MPKFMDVIRHGWNAFNKEETQAVQPWSYSESYGNRPDKVRHMVSNDRSIVSAIYTRLSIDVAAVDLQHVKLDDNGNYLETVNSGLNYCLSTEANIDQAARAFKQDVAMTLFDKGTIAIVPVDTTLDPKVSGSFDIKSLRVGTIVGWMPTKVRVNLYNEKTGLRQEVVLPKSMVAIVENPLSMVMNEPNSTLQRLIRKLSLLDSLDEQASSGKLDLIIQLPYVIKSDARKQQAEQRRKDIEVQMSGSQYGIAYTDGTEKITQLNRPAENNMQTRVEYLTGMLYAQLGLTEEIFNGTADEKTMLNYYNRTIEPVLAAVSEAMHRTFLTKTARTQGHAMMFFRDPFTLIPLADMAELADKLTRNEIMTSNEIRAKIGLKPAADPAADELRNKNVPLPVEALPPPTPV